MSENNYREMDLATLLHLPGITQEQLALLNEGIMALAKDGDTVSRTWEQKIESLVTLAKATGRYLDAEEGMISPSTGNDYYNDARRNVLDAYAEFCEWRHDEPYVVDEIKALLRPLQEEYTDITGIRMTIVRDIPEHPLINVVFPEHCTLSIEQINAAFSRLRERAGMAVQQLPSPFKELHK